MFTHLPPLPSNHDRCLMVMAIPIAAIREANTHLQLLHTRNVELEAALAEARSENVRLQEQVKQVEVYANTLRCDNNKVRGMGGGEDVWIAKTPHLLRIGPHWNPHF